MQFPHLSDTSFPDLPTVNVYQFQNNFDYTRWNEKTKITLCNVLWNSDYTDVVKWDTNTQRDTWFNSLTDFWVTELRTSARVVPDGYVKLPIPYDVMARYNYLFVDMPIATSAENMIDYENTEGIRRWYFFVDSIQYLAPNATQVYVVPDVWTNFQNDIDITYMLLERGHAPVAYSDTDEFLANPILNNRYLLAPDVNYDNTGITRSAKFYPYGNGKKYVCFASTCSIGQFDTLGEVTESSSYNPSGTITYSDVNQRYGHQLQVNGLSMGNGRDYSSARTRARVGYSDGLIANNLTVYAIEAKECFGAGLFYSDLLAQCPQFLTTVKASFVVAEECITLGYELSLAGYTIHRVEGTGNTIQLDNLTKSDFAYPNELRRFAKLYTAPYAQLEITDNDGITYDVKVEETGTLSMTHVASVAYPYLNMRTFISGIGGSGSEQYVWRDLKDNLASLSMGESDWFKYCFDWKIPTFALFMEGQTAFMLESFNRNVKQAIQQGLVSYHNSMRSANTAYENVCDQADTAYINTEANAAAAKGNADLSADTGKTNADRLADAGKLNADNSADTNKTIADNNADLAYTTVDRTCTTQSQNLTTANTTTYQNEEQAIAAASQITGYSNNASAIAVSWGNAMVQYTTSADVEKSTATTMNAGIGTIASAALSGAQAGVVMGGVGGASIGAVAIPGIGEIPGVAIGALGGAVIGGIGGAISATTNNVNVGVTTNTAQTVAQAQIDANVNLNANSAQAATLTTDLQNSVKRTVYSNNASSSVAQMNNSNATSRANATDARNTAKTNATNAQTTAKANATVSQTTAKANATSTRDTSKANALATYTATTASAERTRTNVKSNAGYTRQVAELNAKEILENGKYAAMAAILDSRNSAPVEIGPYSGNPQPDYYRTRGVQIKVKTQSDSAIRQTGAMFARFGYALNQVWDVANTGLKLMRHFTYWKATEVWVNDRKSTNNAVNNFIHNMFLNGVTVWNDPEEIGRVNVYDN